MANGMAQRETEGATSDTRSARPDKKAAARLQDDAVWWVKREIKCRACGTKVSKNDFIQKKGKRWGGSYLRASAPACAIWPS